VAVNKSTRSIFSRWTCRVPRKEKKGGLAWKKGRRVFPGTTWKTEQVGKESRRPCETKTGHKRKVLAVAGERGIEDRPQGRGNSENISWEVNVDHGREKKKGYLGARRIAWGTSTPGREISRTVCENDSPCTSGRRRGMPPYSNINNHFSPENVEGIVEGNRRRQGCYWREGEEEQEVLVQGANCEGKKRGGFQRSKRLVPFR